MRPDIIPGAIFPDYELSEHRHYTSNAQCGLFMR